MPVLSIGFAHLPFNPIAVDGVLKSALRHTYHHLYRSYGLLFFGQKGLHQIHHTQRKSSKRPTIRAAKELFSELFATGALFFS